MLAYKAEPPQEIAWKEVNKISRIISNSDTIKFHTVTTSFTRLWQTLNKENKYLTQLTEITHMAWSLRATVQVPVETVPTGKIGRLCNYVILQTFTVSQKATARPPQLWTKWPCQIYSTASKSKQNKKTPSTWLRKWDRWVRQTLSLWEFFMWSLPSSLAMFLTD